MEGPGGPDRPAAGGRPAPRRAVGMAAVTRRADGERSAALTTGLLPEGLVHGVGARGAVSDWTTGLNRGKTAGTGPVCRSSGRSRGSGRHNRALTPRLSPLSTLPERRADRQRRGRGRRRPPWTQRARPQGAWKPQRTRFPQRPQPSSSSRSRSARKDRRRSRASRQASRIRQFFTTLDRPGEAVTHGSGFPAHAGMDPRVGQLTMLSTRIPRTRGDGPVAWIRLPQPDSDSPHTRGWTRGDPAHRGGDGFPAHAGMDPGLPASRLTRAGIPRTRGDGPWAELGGDRHVPDSPHTRGWTAYISYVCLRESGFPAHAGMDLCERCSLWGWRRIPRTRGDGPATISLATGTPTDSPHTRGWTPRGAPSTSSATGFPAHAGMDPHAGHGRRTATGIPRTRGDGPLSAAAANHSHADSPHTRGWTREADASGAGRPGFPAHAGMDRG